VIVSPDGGSVYVGANQDHAVARFERDVMTGRLRFEGCVTGSQPMRTSSACTEIPHRLSPKSLTASPDGRFLFLYSGGRIAVFRRNPDSGALTFVRRMGDAPCKGASCEVLALGANGRALYAADSGIRPDVARFRVNSTTGALHYERCITGSRKSTACTPIRTATRSESGLRSGLAGISALATSGRTLYVAAKDDESIARFALAPQTVIRRGPKGKSRRHRAVFKFRTGNPSKFECKLKGKRVKPKHRHWRHCGSKNRFRHPGRQVYRHLRRGRKVFKVRATDRAKTTDPTPAKRSWRIR